MDEFMLKIRRAFSTVVITLTLTLQSTQVLAQVDDSFENGFKINPARPAEYIYQSYGEQELISIRVLGSINKAGLYHIPKGMQLTTLLSLAGGTTSEADLKSIFISNESSEQNKAQRYNMEHALEKGHAPMYQLQSNDVVFIREKRPIISNDAWKAISVLSVLLTSALTVLAIDDRL